MSFEPVERIRIDITKDGRVDLTGNTSRMFPNGLEWVRASDFDQVRAENKFLLRDIQELLTWRANPQAFIVEDITAEVEQMRKLALKAEMDHAEDAEYAAYATPERILRFLEFLAPILPST